MQWIKHLRICRIRGIACSWGNYFLSRRKMCKGHIFRHQMLFFTLPAEAQSNNILRFLRMLRLVLFLLKSPSLGGGTGGRYATNFGRSKKKKKKYKWWSCHQRWENMLHFPFVADTVLWLTLKAYSCLRQFLRIALIWVKNSYHMPCIDSRKEPLKGAAEENIWLI